MSDFQSLLPVRLIHVRGAAPADVDQTFRVTGAQPSADNLDPANIWAMDVNTFLHGWDAAGANWDRITSTSGALNINVSSISSALAVNVDGVFSGGNTDPDNVGLIAHVRAVAPADADQTLRLTGKNGTVDTSTWALDVSMHDQNGNAYTQINPLPVLNVSSTGTPVNHFKNDSAVAALASSNHDYTVTAGKTLYLQQVESSASGKLKITVQIETGVGTNAWTDKFVQFNSTATPNNTIKLYDPIPVAAGVRVRIVKDNRDHQPQDLYSTIGGYEI